MAEANFTSGKTGGQKLYTVGNFPLVMPIDHPLDQYQGHWHRYDRALGYISRLVFRKYPHATAIDVGANVGDSAALIRSNSPAPILCLEGNPSFIPYLVENPSQIGDVCLEFCFVGSKIGAVSPGNIHTYGGTATFRSEAQSHQEDGIPVRTLNDILEIFPALLNNKLLKIDTDGHDFEILESYTGQLRDQQPVIFFEYDITFEANGPMIGLQTLESLIESGYLHYVVYDNFGNYWGRVEDGNMDRLIDLTTCLFSHRSLSGKPAIYYLDICGFTDTDHDLFSELVSLETQVLLGGEPPYK